MAASPNRSTTSNVTNKAPVSGPFFTFRGAAVYCGYKHPDSFARMLREEKISLPACGPRCNRYACSTLDDFMSNPDAFRASRSARARRHVPKPVSWMKKEERRKSPLTLEGLELIIGKARKHLAWAIQVAWNIPCRPGQDLYSLTFAQSVKWERGGVEVFHRKVQKWVFVRCSDEFMQALEERRHLHKSGHLIEYKGRPVADIGTAFSNSAKRAGLKYGVCPYDIRHLWITTMLDKKVEISAIAHLAGTSPRMIIKNYYEAHASEKEKAVALLPKLGGVKEAPLRLVKPVQVA